MAYIGRQQDGFGVRSRFIYTATGGQTTFTTDDSSNALSYSDGAYVDVYLNGVLLDPSDYTATSLTSIVLDSGASADDVLEVIVYDIFSVFSGTFTNGITASEATITNGISAGSATVTGDLTVDTNTLYVDASADAVSINGTITKTNQTADLTIGDFGGSSHEILVASGGQLNIGTAGNNQLDFKTNNDVRATIDGSGNVIVGGTTAQLTSSGRGNITINGSSESILNLGTGDGQGAYLYHNGTNFDVWNTKNGYIRFGTNNTERMRVTSDGSVGINTNSIHDFGANNHEFQINGVKGGSVAFSRGTNGATEQWALRTSDDDALRFENGSNYATERMRILSDGDVAIGSTSASGKLFVNQTSSASVASYTYANNGAYTGVSHRNRCSRTGSSGYYLYWGESGNGADVEFYVRGDGIVRADGSIIGGGADYAEMFEWDDENSSNEDRRGCSVVLTSGNKIRKATSDDASADIIGIVSGTAMLIGDAEPMKWSGKYNRDDYGSEIWETYTLTEWTEPAVYEDVQIDAVLDEDGNEIEPARTEQREVTEAVEHSYETDKIPSDLTVPSDAVVSSADGDGNTLKRRQLNPSYDDTQTYTPREERQEWDAIGLMGKLRMRAGQPTGDRWIKMRDITSDIEEWLVR